MVTFGLVEFCDKVTKLPATMANAVEDAVFTVPVVVPPATDAIDNSVDAVFDTVIVDRLDEKLMPAPATSDALDDEPLREKLVAAGRPVTEMVIVDRLDDRPMFVPATRLTLDDDPFRLKLVAAGTAGPEMVILFTPVASVMLLPPTRTMVPADVADVPG